ncbi:uncharacterized protein EI90DRAFT_1189930 [Cantharellus anzutake]|uniref:uncharacterized protein n=1 Tax=Cantharellus anzutake TaxID=1750568 RepID=UPI001905FA3B|nr:uncharacterized protein EI90DRAFT_1189930 [Cantharellus anzutake]KAF8330416.1 hypothetical protein EI90DRAFT_1189930 [Cantharellus anzutake]
MSSSFAVGAFLLFYSVLNFLVSIKYRFPRSYRCVPRLGTCRESFRSCLSGTFPCMLISLIQCTSARPRRTLHLISTLPHRVFQANVHQFAKKKKSALQGSLSPGDVCFVGYIALPLR